MVETFVSCSGKKKAHEYLTHKLFEKAVNSGTTSRLTRKKMFDFPGVGGEHINVFVRLTGRLSQGQPDPNQSKKLMFMCLFLFLVVARIMAGTKKETKLFVAENGPFGAPFLTPKFPPKSLCGSLLCVLSQDLRHTNFFLGGPKWGGVCVGAKKFMLKKLKFMCFFRPL